jgi:competence protein ComEC
LVAAGLLLSRRTAWPAVPVAAVLLCVAAAATSAGLHGADLRRGPVPGLARHYATVTAEVELTSDPRLVRPKVVGDHAAPTAVLLHADVRRLTRPDGTTAAVRTPVLLLVDARGHRITAEGTGTAGTGTAAEAGAGTAGAGAAGTGTGAAGPGPGASGDRRSPWLELLPSTRLRVVARLAPALSGGDRVAAVLRVRGKGPPETVAAPSAPQRWAGRLRAGLR